MDVRSGTGTFALCARGLWGAWGKGATAAASAEGGAVARPGQPEGAALTNCSPEQVLVFRRT